MVKAKEEGTIQLTLRNPVDRQELAESAPHRPCTAACTQSARRARRRPVSGSAVTIISGTRVDTTNPDS